MQKTLKDIDLLSFSYTRIVEARNAKFLEDLEISGSNIPRKEVFEEDQVSSKTLGELTVYPDYPPSIKGKQSNQEQSPTKDNENVEPSTLNNQNQDENVEVRRSSRVKKSAISSDYIVYLQESDFDIGLENDPTSFSQAMSSENFNLWHNAMKEEIASMDKNQVWELTKLPEGAKHVGCKWVYKTKRNPSGKIERYKARLVAKGYTQKEGIDYRETLSPVSKKDSFRIIMALVAHFDLELHQMDVKTAFLNGDLEEEASRQWYIKFHNIVSSFGFKENIVDQCIYLKVCTRPDIAFAVGMLGRYQSNPGIEHWKAAKKVMRYLQGTKDLQLIYKHTENLEVVGYSDSDFAGCLDTRKSILSRLLQLRPLWRQNSPIQIFCDNSAAVFFSKNNKSGSRNKHIDIKYLVVMEKVNKKEIVIQHIRTELMVADPMTKALPANSYRNHVDRMGLVNPMRAAELERDLVKSVSVETERGVHSLGSIEGCEQSLCRCTDLHQAAGGLGVSVERAAPSEGLGIVSFTLDTDSKGFAMVEDWARRC
ncbi:Retrovirus-related Pol polyprotein from transposon TNT 1-94 [Sesamum angolense]|uniref:Retrovirus-related Pol polyprotein from transposon TNT 1-94 n=1 Tax=Sesamum angolense TaxID=2727404 RepID=A0AAE1XC27_9LAMI|nr:Retrovirus-related Pol polyprotein from transposon TNT 1-94 [Sesamum angolense]